MSITAAAERYHRDMSVIHISEADAIRDFAALLTRVRSGEEVVIESETSPIAVLRPVVEPAFRLLSETLRILKERGSDVTLDANFGPDLQAAIDNHREALNPPQWD